jgi:amino acid permease
MDITRFFNRLLSSTACATAVFGIVLILMEMLMPGSVLPYVSPIPFVIAGLAGLSVSAVFARPSKASRWKSIVAALMIAAFAFLFSFIGMNADDGKTSVLAIAFIVIGAFSIGSTLGAGSESPTKNRKSLDNTEPVPENS